MGRDSAAKTSANPQRHGLIAGLLAAVFFGFSAPLISVISVISGEASPLMIAALLYTGAALALLVVRAAVGRQQAESPVQRRDLPPLVGLTVLGGVVGPLCLVQGLTLLSAGSASLLLNLEAVFTMLIAVLIGREHLSRNGLIAAALIVAGAVFLSEGSLGGTTVQGGLLIGAACLAWGIDNNLSQRLSLRNPLQISLLKALGASVPMLLLAMGLGQRFPAGPTLLAALAIGAVGYGLSIWLDLLALRELGAAREAVVFATAPFVGALFSVVVLRESLAPPLLMAAGLMAAGVVLLLLERHSHWHRHEGLRHAHRHRHDSHGGDPHHAHDHAPEDLEGIAADCPFWHAHEHRHREVEHAHSHVSDAHHRHRH
jgi:drug/metabolite transporter (DMT)-like permease